MTLRILKPGGACLLVDEGRWGYQRWGVPVGGPMDAISWRLACSLCGQPTPSTALELTLGGAVFVVEAEQLLIAVAGPLDFILVDGQQTPANRPIWLSRGAVVKVPIMSRGSHCYVALSTGFKVCALLGSFSALQGCNVRGQQGGPLTAGALLVANEGSAVPCPISWRRAGRRAWPRWSVCARHWREIPQKPFRVLLDSAHSAPLGLSETLLSALWTVSSHADRQGIRLSGTPLTWPSPPQGSEATVAGSIQVPPSGEPIILCADRQPTGGYPVIGTIALVDHCRLGQLRPEDSLKFEIVEPAKARELLHTLAQRMTVLEEGVRQKLSQSFAKEQDRAW